MYKVKYKICPTYISDLFQHDNGHNLRNSDFIIPRFNTVTSAKHSIKSLGPVMWAKLTKDLRSQTCLGNFKKLIRTCQEFNTFILCCT
jgi:hypothetical protein